MLTPPSQALGALGALLLAGLFVSAPRNASAEAATNPDVAARLAPKWLAAAKQIHTPEHVIYYQGSAKGTTAPDGKHWTGDINGEVLVLTPTMATACSAVRLGATGSIAIQGPHRSKLAEGLPPWKKLLTQQQ